MAKSNNSTTPLVQSSVSLPVSPLRRKIYYFFWWCAGSDIEKLEECPSDYEKHISLGVFVLFTGIFAFIAMSYAMSYVFLSSSIGMQSVSSVGFFSILFGALWGFFIFFLDRYIVSTMRKNEWYKQFLYAIPRLILAIAISIGISKPLELRIFHDKLNTQRMDDREAFILGIITQKENEYHIPELRVLIAEKDSALKYNISLQGKEPPSSDGQYLSFKQAYNEADARYTKDIPSINENIKKLQLDIDFIKNGEKYKDALGEITPEGRSLLLSLQSELRKYKVSRSSLVTARSNAGFALSNYRIAYNNKIGNNINTYEQEKKEFSIDKKRLDSLVNLVRIEAEKAATIGFRPNLAQQIISLENLEKSDEGARKLGWFLFIFFIIIETTPVIQKLLSSRSMYDMKVEGETDIASVRNIDEIQRFSRQIRQDEEDEININQEVNEIRRQSMIEVNKELYEAIAAAQAEIGKIAIERWKNEQLKNVKNEDLSNYIPNNNT